MSSGLEPSSIADSPVYLLHNASVWQNLTAWTADITRYAPSVEDLVWAGPRIVRKLGSFISFSDNDAVDSLIRGTAQADPNLYDVMPAPNVVMDAAQEAMQAQEIPIPAAASSPRFSMDIKGLGGMLSYTTSRWAISCLAMAIILNRTHLYGATRRRLQLSLGVRLILRIVPIVLLAFQVLQLLQSIQCQTSPDFALMRWGDANKTSELMFAHPNKVLNSLSSMLLFGAEDRQSCEAVHMTTSTNDDSQPSQIHGSLTLLWPMFVTICLSHFVETLSCAVQGRPVAVETGMTLFEQSLAFAEADAAIIHQLESFKFPITTLSGTSMTRAMVLERVNTSPEVLVMAFFSATSHLTSQLLAIFGLQARFRIFHTGLWAICFMAFICWNFYTIDLADPSRQGLLRLPTVCIIGFIPHILVLSGIIMCTIIYSFAVVLSAIALPDEPGQSPVSLTQRTRRAHANMQTNSPFSEAGVARHMDFYTALLRTGFAAISMASEAVYLNEDRGVSLKQRTWLEEERLKEVEELQKQWVSHGLNGASPDSIGAIGLIPVESGAMSANGYARERAAQTIAKGRGERNARTGIGASERSSRLVMAFEYLLSVYKLGARVMAISTLGVIGLITSRRPAWLVSLARRPKDEQEKKPSAKPGERNGPRLGLAYDANGRIARTDGIDVEAEFRRTSNSTDEEHLEADLYQYWLRGGWWGSKDGSGDYEQASQDDDFDTTSVISMSTNADNDDEGWESDRPGQRTPTQRSPYGSREGSPFADSPLAMRDLARLLHPTSHEEREDARALAAHLASDGVMTRSQYRRHEILERTRILAQPHIPAARRGTKLSPEEEEDLLERMLVSRRQQAGEAMAWAEGGGGMGSGGPQCVVCQCAPRTIIVWPCRCLSLCDDCRVSLATNQFDKCVCCRREVISFSRIYVP